MMKSFILLALVPQVSPSPVPIQCKAFGINPNPMLQKLITISPSQINDGYCDCPLDGIDEPNTSACSGSIDGGWAGVLPKYKPTDEQAAQISSYFVCHQQPNLKLPLSRVNDGICDCCDGSDEVPSTTTPSTSSSSTANKCPDNCDIVLAAEREARQKVINDYNIGSQKRLDSISQYKQWYTDSETKVEQMKNVELNTMEKEYHDTIKKIKDAKYTLAINWMTTIDTTVNQNVFIKELFSIDEYDSSNLSLFIIGLCKLSGELSNDNVANDRCVAFDRASLDLGYLWEYGSGSDSDELPNYTTVGDDIPNLIEYAEKIILRLDGKDTVKDKVKTNNKKVDKSPADPLPDSSGDDPYGDDWHDEHDYHYDDDYVESDDEFDEYNEESVEDEGDATEEKDEEVEEKDEEEDAEGCQIICPMDVHECPDGSFKSRDPCNDCNFEQCEGGEDDTQLSANERLLKSLLDGVPLDRSLFKEQSDMLLNKISAFEEEAKEAAEEAAKNTEANGEGDNGDDESSKEADDTTEEEDTSNGVDPMAYRMVKTNIKKHLANISRGETAARSTARFIASMIDREGDQALQIALRQLAIMTIYHSCVSVEDLAELIFSTAKSLRSTADESPCPTSWDTMCSPGTKHEYPPSFIVEAAQHRCEQRSSSGVCPVVVDDEVDIPASISDGYYNYYAPQTCNPDDVMTKHFTSIDSLHQKPTEIKALNKQKDDIDRKKRSLTKKIDDLERDLVGGDGGNSKYGVGGELYSMRDTCFKVESGKYEYETCIFGKATQRDIGQTSGGTNLGNYEKIEFENGIRTLKWGGGTKCWNGPVRSAEVEVTCGAETKLLTANEPDTCRYVFTMESPIACDDTFKKTHVDTI